MSEDLLPFAGRIIHGVEIAVQATDYFTRDEGRPIWLCSLRSSAGHYREVCEASRYTNSTAEDVLRDFAGFITYYDEVDYEPDGTTEQDRIQFEPLKPIMQTAYLADELNMLSMHPEELEIYQQAAEYGR